MMYWRKGLKKPCKSSKTKNVKILKLKVCMCPTFFKGFDPAT